MRVFFRYLYTALASFCLLGAAQTAVAQDKNDVTGLYCHATVISLSSPLNVEGGCDAPYKKVTGLNYCQVNAAQSSEVLQARVTKSGDLEFAVSIAELQYAHNCGVVGTAKKIKDGWRYESDLTSNDPELRCGLTITLNKQGDLVFQPDANAQCRSQCGAHASYEGISFTATSRVKKTIDETLFQDTDKFFSNVLCPNLPMPAAN